MMRMERAVTDCLSQEELLLQLAEEAAELSHAALKLRRVMDGSNPTPVSYRQAVNSLNEEAADVQLTLDMICLIDRSAVRETRSRKLARWILRLNEKRRNEDAGEEA